MFVTLRLKVPNEVVACPFHHRMTFEILQLPLIVEKGKDEEEEEMMMVGRKEENKN